MNVEERVQAAVEMIDVQPRDVGTVILEGQRRRRRSRMIAGLVSAAGAVALIAVMTSIIAAPSADRGASPVQQSSDSPSALETPRHDPRSQGVVELVPLSQRGASISLTGNTTSGTTLDVADLRGNVVVVWMWGSSCEPCREMLPMINALAQRTDIKVVGVAFDEPSGEGFQAEEARLGVRFDSIVNPSDDMLKALSDRREPVAPTLVVLDRDGRVAALAVGEFDAGFTLDEAIKSVSDEPDVPSYPLPSLLVVRNSTPDRIWITFTNGNKASLEPGKELRLGSAGACSLMPLSATTLDGEVLDTYDEECAGQTWIVRSQAHTP